MKTPKLSVKRVALEKNNARLIIIISVTVFVVMFSIVSIKSFYTQMRYQSKVIGKKETTLKQIQTNIKEVESLNRSYQEFSSEITNVIGGNPKGNGDRDGENSKIILDALPSKYDYPALLSSLNKLVANGGFRVNSITGTDDELNQALNGSSSSPVYVEMPFTLEASTASSPAEGKKFLQLFEKSIRPVVINKLTIEGKETGLDITVDAKTYFQPEKKLNVTEEVVK